MKKITILSLFLLINFCGKAQGNKKFTENTSSIENIVSSIYEVVSGKKGEERNWELMKIIFHPDARLIMNYTNKEGEHEIYFYSVEDYISTFREGLKQSDLYEKDVKNQIDVFGNMAQVFSTFKSYKSKTDEEPFKKGMASIQLFNDGERWWVLSMYWKNESEDSKIPSEYLPED